VVILAGAGAFGADCVLGWLTVFVVAGCTAFGADCVLGWLTVFVVAGCTAFVWLAGADLAGACVFGWLTVFVVAIVAMGIIISAIARDQLFATQLLMLIAVPSFLVRGFTWPQISMLGWIRDLSNLLPLTHFVLPLRQIFMQGADFSIIRPHLLWLWTLAAASYGLAYMVIWRTLAVARRTQKTALPEATSLRA
jgi:ABC-2 type transport system permease protein